MTEDMDETHVGLARYRRMALSQVPAQPQVVTPSSSQQPTRVSQPAGEPQPAETRAARSARRASSDEDLDWLYRDSKKASANRSAPIQFLSTDDGVEGSHLTAYEPEETSDEPLEDSEEPSETSEEPAASGKKPKKIISRRRKYIYRGLIALGVVVALILSIGGYYVFKATSALCNATNGTDCNVGTVARMVGQVVLVGGGGQQGAEPLKTDGNGRTNILLLGTSDDRPDSGGGAWLTDSILIISLSQARQDAYMISVPRDLWVQYGGWCTFGYQGKINVAYECKGAKSGNTAAETQKALTDTIPIFENITGLKIQYAANLNYSVLVSLVKAVGGKITVKLNTTDSRGIYDINTGIKLQPNTATCPSKNTKPLVCTLTPYQTLNLARARNSDGGYGLASSNFNREQNQQAIIVGLMDQASKNGLFGNLPGINTALEGIGTNLRSTFSIDDIPLVASLVQNIPAANFTSLDFANASPAIVHTANMNGQSSVVPIAGTFNYTALQNWIAKKMTPATAADEAATIDVLNGTTVAGEANTIADEIKALGLKVGIIGNYSSQLATTQIYDVTRNKPLTSSILAKQFGVKVTKGVPDGFTPGSMTDFVVIIGG